MTFLQVQREILRLERGIAITDPEAMRTHMAHLFVPAESQPMTPLTWTNDFRFQSAERQVQRRQWQWQVGAAFYAGTPNQNQDRTAQIAVSFFEAFIEALDADMTLGGTCQEAVLEGGSLGVLSWGGMPYIGFNLTLGLRYGESLLFDV